VFGAISYYDKKGVNGFHVIVDPEKCVECDICVDICPLNIIEQDDETEHRRRFERIEIIPEKCIGCALCKKACPVGAINGKIKSPFVVDPNKCVKCGVCISKCKKDAFAVDYLD